MMDEEVASTSPVENAKRKAAANAFLNISKKSSSKMKRVTWLLRKRQEDKRLTDDEQQFLNDNPKLVDQFNKRREKRKEYQTRHIETEDSPEILQEKCAQLAQAIHDAEFLVVYTGAGISTSANIPDYRGPNGIWTRLQKGEDIGSHDLTEAEPTLTHMALGALQKCGRLHHIVSQNCDGLHLRSGLPKTALSEVHGNMYIEVCRKCVPAREYVRTFDVTERTSTYKHATGRYCYRCGEPLVDSIVHFGERGKLRWPLNWQGACQAANAADTILCIGSSLKVLKKYTWLWQMDRPARRRPRLYIVNLQWTPKDKEATLKINGKCDEVMQLVMDYLGMETPAYNRSEDFIFDMATPLHPDELNTTTRPCLLPPPEEEDKGEDKEECSSDETNSVHRKPVTKDGETASSDNNIHPVIRVASSDLDGISVRQGLTDTSLLPTSVVRDAGFCVLSAVPTNVSNVSTVGSCVERLSGQKASKCLPSTDSSPSENSFLSFPHQLEALKAQFSGETIKEQALASGEGSRLLLPGLCNECVVGGMCTQLSSVIRDRGKQCCKNGPNGGCLSTESSQNNISQHFESYSKLSDCASALKHCSVSGGGRLITSICEIPSCESVKCSHSNSSFRSRDEIPEHNYSLTPNSVSYLVGSAGSKGFSNSSSNCANECSSHPLHRNQCSRDSIIKSNLCSMPHGNEGSFAVIIGPNDATCLETRNITLKSSSNIGHSNCGLVGTVKNGCVASASCIQCVDAKPFNGIPETLTKMSNLTCKSEKDIAFLLSSCKTDDVEDIQLDRKTEDVKLLFHVICKPEEQKPFQSNCKHEETKSSLPFSCKAEDESSLSSVCKTENKSLLSCCKPEDASLLAVKYKSKEESLLTSTAKSAALLPCNGCSLKNGVECEVTKALGLDRMPAGCKGCNCVQVMRKLRDCRSCHMLLRCTTCTRFMRLYPRSSCGLAMGAQGCTIADIFCSCLEDGKLLSMSELEPEKCAPVPQPTDVSNHNNTETREECLMYDRRRNGLKQQKERIETSSKFNNLKPDETFNGILCDNRISTALTATPGPRISRKYEMENEFESSDDDDELPDITNCSSDTNHLVDQGSTQSATVNHTGHFSNSILEESSVLQDKSDKAKPQPTSDSKTVHTRQYSAPKTNQLSSESAQQQQQQRSYSAYQSDHNLAGRPKPPPIEITLDDTDSSDAPTTPATKSAPSLPASNFYGTGLCIRSALDSCDDSTSQDDGEDDDEDDDEEMSEGESVIVEDDEPTEANEMDEDGPELEAMSVNGSSISNCDGCEAPSLNGHSCSIVQEVSFDETDVLKESCTDATLNLRYYTSKGVPDNKSRIKTKSLRVEDIMEFTSGDSLDGTAEDCNNSSRQLRNSAFNQSNSADLLIPETVITQSKSSSQVGVDVRWKRNGSSLLSDEELLAKGQLVINSLALQTATRNGGQDEKIKNSLFEALIKSSVTHNGMDHDPQMAHPHDSDCVRSLQVNGTNLIRVQGSVVQEPESNELKSIWVKSFCGPRQNEPLGRPSKLTALASSKAQLASMILGQVKDLVDRKQLLTGKSHVEDNVKKLWFWGFDEAMINLQRAESNISNRQENIERHMPKGSSDAINSFDTKKQFLSDSKPVSLDNVSAPCERDACDQPKESVDSEDLQEEEEEDGEKAELPAAGSPPRRMTRSRTRTTSHDTCRGDSGSGSNDKEEQEPECCYCEGELNPALCSKSRNKERSNTRLPPDEDMLRARAVIARRRIINYRRFEPVFAVKMRKVSVEKRKLKGKESSSGGKDVKLRKVNCEEEENLNVQRNEDIENERSEEEVEKILKKVTPGWYGKGYRKIIRKRVPKSYPLK